ncbi:SDR family NAD(P)-dependent oxidoreductase [Paenarthrobacter sp. Z7-10]|uniref:SDR family NAD(P)-dependent oxidoreductase n=1 Tax=Paenarthrobacter sp. Z7-10 TaxID=2787635 RepID=UPI0022A93682|nr:SDR family NAD(P)-dependent oxidoreductase [Paenarthrobacter sp. Z7-10]MCZ2402041.1 SDR family NAD(P)-dependent oxidoreductase [Paenarthrobacter sp. Z7-10]
MDLQDRSILLTGAGSGIGREMALELASRSVRLTLVGRRSEPLEEVAAMVRERGGQAHVVALDLTAPGAPAAVVAAAQDRFSGVDVLINNAGNVRAGRLEALDESEVLAQIALNLTAPILLTRAAIPALRDSGDGLVVNVSSGIGLIGLPFYSTYAATKAGIAHFGEALRRELLGEGVHVLNVYPGATSTPMMDSSQAGVEHGFEYESPQDVAAAAVAGMEQGALSVVRGGATRSAMIALNREDPAAVDRTLFARKGALEEAVAEHSSL